MNTCCLDMLQLNERTKQMEKDKVISTLNEMLSVCEPITYQEINTWFGQVDSKLEEAEKSNKSIVISGKFNPDNIKDRDNDSLGVTTLGVMATMSDILCGERLCVRCEIKPGESHGVITSFGWESNMGLGNEQN